MSGYHQRGLAALRDSIVRSGDQIDTELVAMAMTFLRFMTLERRLVEAAYGLLDGNVPLARDRVTVASQALGLPWRKAQQGLGSATWLLRQICLLIASDPQDFRPGLTEPHLVLLAVLPLSGRTLTALKREGIVTLGDLLALEPDTPKGLEKLRWLSGIGTTALAEINGALLSVGEAPLAGFENRKK